MPWKTYIFSTGSSAIGHAVDSLIGENLTGGSLESARCADRIAAALRPLTRGPTKNTHPIPSRRAFYTRMNKNGQLVRRRPGGDYALAAMEQMELYCATNPGSPAAVRRPRLFVRGELWIALLGPSVEEGIIGIGATVRAALRAFDSQYLAGLRPRAEMITNYRPVRIASSDQEDSIS